LAEALEMSETRKLAAILVSDVVGYSRLAGADEDRILARLRTLRSDLIDPTIAVHHGRIVKRTGDGSIVEFRSVVDAVRCAIEVQNGMRERNAGVPDDQKIQFRVGIHLGDVVEESDGDLMGDGVNIAARLQSIAQPGAICLSEQAYWQVKQRLNLKVSDLGATQLKNIAEPMRVFALEVGVPADAKLAAATSAPAAPETPRAPKRRFALAFAVLGVAALAVAAAGAWHFLGAKSSAPNGPQQLSIVVLPFTNLSGDANQDYFADVLTDQLTTYISRIPGSSVIARGTAFTYKGKPTDMKQIGKDLGVHYALEGSVQPTGNRIRVNAQLIDTENGVHLWADEFDHDRADLLQVEDDIVTRLARALQIQLTNIEAARLQLAHPTNPDAQELAMRCQAAYLNFGPYGDQAEAGYRLCEQALESDPDNVTALAMLATKFSSRLTNDQSSDRQADIKRTGELASRALALDPNSPDAHYAKGNFFVLSWRFDEAKAEYERAIALNPSQMNAYTGMCIAYLNSGLPDDAIALAQKALHLSPRDSQRYGWLNLEGLAYLMQRRDDQAVEAYRQSVAANSNLAFAQVGLAAALAPTGHDAEARETLQRYLALPGVRTKSIAALRKQANSDNSSYLAMRERIYEGLRKAGMPEG
jgi:adenylate cyclase